MFTESNVLRGRVVDMRVHDLEDDTWMICRSGSRAPVVIGSKEQIMTEFDKINESGVIPDYKNLQG